MHFLFFILDLRQRRQVNAFEMLFYDPKQEFGQLPEKNNVFCFCNLKPRADPV